MYYFEICDINFVFKKTTCSFLISNAFFEISCGCEGSENKRKPPKHGYQRVIFCWFTNISQPFSHLQYTGKQSPPFYLIHFLLLLLNVQLLLRLIQYSRPFSQLNNSFKRKFLKLRYLM